MHFAQRFVACVHADCWPHIGHVHRILHVHWSLFVHIARTRQIIVKRCSRSCRIKLLHHQCLLAVRVRIIHNRSTTRQLRHAHVLAAELALRAERAQKAQLTAGTAKTEIEPLAAQIAVDAQRVLQRHSKHFAVGQIQDATGVEEDAPLVRVRSALQQILFAVHQLMVKQEESVRVVPQIRRHPDGVGLQKEARAVRTDRRTREMIETRLDATEIFAVSFACKML